MGYKSPYSEFPPDDDPDEPQHSNGHKSENLPNSSPNDKSEESQESPAAGGADEGGGDKLPPQPGLGLPDDYEDRHIPTFSQLREVADRRLDWETAFMILHHDDPDLIVARLDEMAELIRAAISVQGPQLGNPERFPSLKKAVRLGLALDLRYWLRANKFEAWLDLISPLLTTAIQMEEFQAAVFRTWSIYQYFDGKLAKAQTAMKASQDFAAESGRDDLALLAQAYQFNFDVSKMTLDEAEKTAQNLIFRAKTLGYEFVRGQMYVLLARVYSDKWHDFKKIFEYAQQALAILIYGEHFEMASEALTLMLGVIGIRDDHSPVYRDALRAYFGHVTEKSVNPIFQASVYFFQGRDQHYFRGQFDEALPPLLCAWRKYRQAYMPVNVARTLHMLGMVQTKRRKWSAAEFYLGEAIKRYRAMNHKGYEIHALHAYAFIPYEYEDWALTLSRLEAAHAVAVAHRDAVAQEVIDEIEHDIEHVKEKLQHGD